MIGLSNELSAENPPVNSAIRSLPAPAAANAETKQMQLLSGNSLQVVQANDKMPWVFDIHSPHRSDLTTDGDDAPKTGDSLTLRYSIYRVDLGQRVLSGQREIVTPIADQTQRISIDDQAPKTAGIYEVRFKLVRRSNKLWARLRTKDKMLEELRVPMLVERPASTAAVPVTSWQTIGRIHPSGTTMALGQWLPDSAARLIPGMRHVKGKLQQGQADGKSVFIVQPKSVFQAKLPIMATGYPHRITIRCPRDQASGLRIDLGQGDDQTQSSFSSIVQSCDALSLRQRRSDRRQAVLQDEQRSSTDKNGSSEDRWLTRTFLYYPRPDDQIWLTNLNEATSVAFESIEVTAGPATSTNLMQRQFEDRPIMREMMMSISDSTWPQRWTEDWQATGDSAACEARSVELHRVWLAAHRAVEQIQQIGISSLSIPAADSTDQAVDQQFAEKQTVALHVFERYEMMVRPSVALGPDQPDAMEKTIDQWKKFRCFDGFVVTIVNPSQVKDETLASLRRVSQSKRLFLRTSAARLNKKTRDAIGNLDNVVFVSNYDCSNATHSAADLAPTKLSPCSGIALVNCSIASLDPSACLFETIHRFRPSVVMVGESVVRGVVDERLSRTCKSFESLPANYITEITSLDASDGTCHVSQAVIDDRILVSISNLAPWHNVVKLEMIDGSNQSHGTKSLLSDAILWERMDDGAFDSVQGSKLNQGLNIPARDTVLLRSRFAVPKSSQAGVKSWRWSAQVAQGDPVIDQIKEDVTVIVERMGTLTDPDANDQLNNGSFETVGEMGLVGWLHAQHPPGCVVVDPEEAIDGSRSIRLKTDRAISARTWLVSDTISVPTSGRLAVSMALRGESLPSDGPTDAEAARSKGSRSAEASAGSPSAQQSGRQPNEKLQYLRVSIEGTQSGVPMRKSADVEIHRSGDWQPRRVVLEVDSIDPNTTDSLRLTIDSMTPGLVWVDDIRLHDDFPTTRERTELQSQTFLAVEGLQRGNLTPSAKLLMNRWACRLLEQSDQVQEVQANSSMTSESAKSPSKKDVPEVANRNRAWLLERLRF